MGLFSYRSHRVSGVAVLLTALLIGGAATVVSVGLGSSDASRPDGGDYPALGSGVLGDVDGDGSVSAEEESDLEASEAAVDAVRTTLAPPETNTFLVTPPGEDWWRLVTSVATQNAAWNAAAPQGVDWYAYGETESVDPVGGATPAYDVIYVAFPDEQAGIDWVQAQSSDGSLAAVTFSIRGRVVAILPASINDYGEEFPVVDEKVLDDIEVPVGLWAINLSQHIDHRALESRDAEAYRAFWQRLGFAESGATWSATSARPDAAWAGAVTGFDANKIDITEAGAVLNRSQILCDGTDKKCRPDRGLSGALEEMYVFRGDQNAGVEDWKSEAAPEDADLVITMTAAWRGKMTGSFGINYSPIRQFTWWVKDGTMVIDPEFEGEVPGTA